MDVKKFLGMFKDPLFVSIPLKGGAVHHTKNMDAVMARNEESTKDGAYFTVNGFAKFKEGEYHGRTKALVTTFNCCFLDIDLTPEARRTEAEILYKELVEKGLPPTAIVLTGKGMHVYWLFKEPVGYTDKALADYEALQNAIVSRYKSRGADPQARDAARVLRIPGGNYYNKEGAKTCEIELLYLDEAVKYTPIEIAKFFGNTIETSDAAGMELLRAADEFDYSTMLNVKKGSRHADAYRAALSLIQRTKDLASARKMFHATLSTWESPANDPLDWNDAWKQFENAKRFIEKDKPNAFLGDPLGKEALPTITIAKDVEMKKLEWLWDGHLAKGKPHMLTGEPGLGKSQITLDIAARLSTGTAFPSAVLGGKPHPPTGVLILSAEDDAADTMVPRLTAAGADLSKIGFLSSSILEVGRDKKPKMRALALRDDAERILEAIATLPMKIELVIIDPISAFLSSAQDSNSNSDARGTIAQLQHAIMDKGISLLMINHTNKNVSAKTAHMRSMGSVGWNAAARATFYVFKDGDDGKRRVFSIGKTNLAKEVGKGFFYTVEDKMLDIDGVKQSVPYVKWDVSAFPTRTADEYSGDDGKAKNVSSECEKELKSYMFARGEVKSADALKFMKERGYSQAEVYRTARRMGIIGEYGVWKEDVDSYVNDNK